jgi:hypothetical protein
MKTTAAILLFLFSAQFSPGQNCPASTVVDGVELPVVQIRTQCFYYVNTGHFIEQALANAIDLTFTIADVDPLSDMSFVPTSASLLDFQYVYSTTDCNPSEEVTIALEIDFEAEGKVLAQRITTTGSIRAEVHVRRNYISSVEMIDTLEFTTVALASTEVLNTDLDIDVSNPLLAPFAFLLESGFLDQFILPTLQIDVSSIFKLDDEVIRLNAAISGPSVICGSPVTLSVQEGYENYAWSDGSDGASIVINEPGAYSVQITHQCNVTSSSVEIGLRKVEDFISISLLCDDKIRLSVPYESVHWSTGSASDTIEVTASGIYEAVAVDEAGCEGSDRVQLNIEEFCRQAPLVTPLCSENPNTMRRWKITNPNLENIRIDWEILGSFQKAWLDIAPGESFLTTNTVKLSTNTLRVFWHDQNGNIRAIEQAPASEKCPKTSQVAARAKAVEIYPNPTADHFQMMVASDTEQEVSFQIQSISGAVWHEGQVRLSPGDNFIYNDVSNYPQGEYIVRVGNETTRIVKR